jgi:hypothetical protein
MGDCAPLTASETYERMAAAISGSP